jgi:hypothetical protein
MILFDSDQGLVATPLKVELLNEVMKKLEALAMMGKWNWKEQHCEQTDVVAVDGC